MTGGKSDVNLGGRVLKFGGFESKGLLRGILDVGYFFFHSQIK